MNIDEDDIYIKVISDNFGIELKANELDDFYMNIEKHLTCEQIELLQHKIHEALGV